VQLTRSVKGKRRYVYVQRSDATMRAAQVSVVFRIVTNLCVVFCVARGLDHLPRKSVKSSIAIYNIRSYRRHLLVSLFRIANIRYVNISIRAFVRLFGAPSIFVDKVANVRLGDLFIMQRKL